MAAVTVYVTAPNNSEAIHLAQTVVNERLAACANVLGGLTSVYRWEGAVQEDPEVAIVLKTRRDLVEALSARIAQLHSYDCPCITAHDIVGGNPSFLQWIETETNTE